MFQQILIPIFLLNAQTKGPFLHDNGEMMSDSDDMSKLEDASDASDRWYDCYKEYSQYTNQGGWYQEAKGEDLSY